MAAIAALMLSVRPVTCCPRKEPDGRNRGLNVIRTTRYALSAQGAGALICYPDSNVRFYHAPSAQGAGCVQLWNNAERHVMSRPADGHRSRRAFGRHFQEESNDVYRIRRK